MKGLEEDASNWPKRFIAPTGPCHLEPGLPVPIRKGGGGGGESSQDWKVSICLFLELFNKKFVVFRGFGDGKWHSLRRSRNNVQCTWMGWEESAMDNSSPFLYFVLAQLQSCPTHEDHSQNRGHGSSYLKRRWPSFRPRLMKSLSRPSSLTSCKTNIDSTIWSDA